MMERSGLAAAGPAVVTAADVVAGHVTLDVSCLDRVFSQPYDKISHQLQEEYYRRSPHNVVHITKSLEKNQNPETDYPQAGATLGRCAPDVS